MIRVTYTWQHVCSGKNGHSQKVFMDEKHFERALAHWNWQQPETWNYAKAGDTQVKAVGKDQFAEVYPQYCY